MTIANDSQALVPRNAFQQDVPPPDNRLALVDAPPRAPSPPPAPKSLPAAGVNVFDFLVTDGKDATSASATPKPVDEFMSDDDEEWEDAEDVFMDLPPDYDKVEEQMYNARRQFELDGFSYGSDPLVPPAPNPMAYFVGTDNDVKTPAIASKGHSRNISTDSTTKKSGKRKRSQPEDLDLSRIRGYASAGDVVMTDVPPALHSGLTGGLQKMMMNRPGFPFPPSPDDSNGDVAEPLPQSPIKRSRRAKDEKKERGRSREKRRDDKDRRDKREHRTHKKSRRTSDESHKPGHWERRRARKRSESPIKEKEPTSLIGKALKAIEYHPTGSSVSTSKKDVEPKAHDGNAVILHPTKASSRAQMFMQFVETVSEPGGERGCSVHKALRRYHRERPGGNKEGKVQEEKELWKDLRLRVNDRGEVVLFVG